MAFMDRDTRRLFMALAAACCILYALKTTVMGNTSTVTLSRSVPSVARESKRDSRFPPEYSRIDRFFRKAETYAYRTQGLLRPGQGGVYDVTLITQLSCRPHSRLEVMRDLISRWQGHASVAVYIMDESEVDVVAQLYDNSPVLRKYATLHLVYMSDATRQHPLFRKHGIQMVYPINTLRNVALDTIGTDWALHVDVDFGVMPMTQLEISRQLGLQSLNTPVCTKTVFILPAFEIDPEERRPNNKAELKAAFYSSTSSVRMFAASLCPICHGGTSYDRFFAVEPNQAGYYVPYTSRWEPYTIAHKTQPRYDEAFTGRHLNKNMHIWDLACHAHDFYVLPNAWVMHGNKHAIIPYEKENYRYMEGLWEEHVAASESICVRYRRNMKNVRKYEPTNNDLSYAKLKEPTMDSMSFHN